ncbi:MAG: hypothetical protein R6U52_02715 [Kosmotogaceae bacterium]
MKKLLLILLLSLTCLAFSNTALLEKAPSEVFSLFLVEDIKDNYGNLKETVLADFFLNQMALEQTVAQLIEMNAYSNDINPDEVYAIFDGGLMAATWNDEQGNERMIIIIGPVKNASDVKTSFEKVFTQAIQFNLPDIKVQNDFIFIGDVSAYSSAKKGFSESHLKSDLPEGFAYLYMLGEDFLVQGSMWYENKMLKGKTYMTPLNEEAIENTRDIIGSESTTIFEEEKHLSFASVIANVEDISRLESVIQGEGNQNDTSEESLLSTGIDTDVMKSIGEKLTGKMVIDMDLSVESLLSGLMNSQGGSNGDMMNQASDNATGFDVVSRIGFSGNINDVEEAFKASGEEYEYSADGIVVDDMHIWVYDGWLYASTMARNKTLEQLSKGKPLSEYAFYDELVQKVPEKRFLLLFVNAGHIISSITGDGVESGLLFSLWYSNEFERIEGLFLLK